MKIIKYYPVKSTKPLAPFPFLALPPELRNKIYSLYFARDIYSHEIVWSRSYRWLTKKRITFYELLLTNRQIHKEALSIAIYEYMRQLRKKRQFYVIPDTDRRPAGEWVLSPGANWAPECRNVFAFAKLRLSNIALVMYVWADHRFMECILRLRGFFSLLVDALREYGATQSIQLYLDKTKKIYWKRLYSAVAPLTQLLGTCDIIVIASDPRFITAFKSYQNPGRPSLKICTQWQAKRDGHETIGYVMGF